MRRIAWAEQSSTRRKDFALREDYTNRCVNVERLVVAIVFADVLTVYELSIHLEQRCPNYGRDSWKRNLANQGQRDGKFSM